MVPRIDSLESRHLLSSVTGLQAATVQDLNGLLTSTSAVASNDVWAVGGSLVEHFNGTSWNVVPTAPLPSGDFAQINGVVALAHNDVWAVGTVSPPGGVGSSNTPLIEHFDGTTWSIAPSPNLPGGTLRAIAAASAHDIWAVGIQGGFFTHELIEHFDGTTWSAVPGPPVSARSHRGLDAVSADAPNDAWAVGSVGRGQNALGNELLHWNGTAWSVATPPNVNVAGITALSPTNVWAVGSSTSSSVASIAHFDGASWSVVASPAPRN
ncbi:MAG: hypothetical protein JO034_15490, partial [Singulisphaera sp.]|nr:hypothetical protein [Singulisphaera sp.]